MPPSLEFNESFHLSRLENGVLLATVEMPFMRSVCLGVWALVGSRHESRRLNGIAHFVEHMVFKGTRRRKAAAILREIEGIGGTVNAFTELDHTCYYAKAEADKLDRIADVLFDIYGEAVFPPDEIEREREVVEEEIIMYRENPGQHVEDVFGLAAWPDCALGRPITGSPESLRRIGGVELKEFVSRRYHARGTLVTVAGRITHGEALRRLAPFAARLAPGGRRAPVRAFPVSARSIGPVIRQESREISQVHFNLGFHSPGRTSRRRFALKILNVILGENMSSRLFQRLREEMGLCYTVQSDLTLLQETGMCSIYAGVDAQGLGRALRATVRELRRIVRRPPSKRELQRAVEYATGMIRLSRESTTQQMFWLGECLLAHGRVVDPDAVCEALSAVTPGEVSAVAAELFRPERACLALVGPQADADALRAELARLS